MPLIPFFMLKDMNLAKTTSAKFLDNILDGTVKVDAGNADDVAIAVTKTLLQANEREAKNAYTVIAKHPNLLYRPIVVADQLDRRIGGTILQILAMASGNLSSEGNPAKKIIAMGLLKTPEVDKQLQCITSKEAIQENKKRKQQIISAFQAFCQDVVYSNPRYAKESFFSFSPLTLPNEWFKPDYGSCELRCQRFIKQLEKNLNFYDKDIITKGYVFDANITSEIYSWYNNFSRGVVDLFPERWGSNMEINVLDQYLGKIINRSEIRPSDTFDKESNVARRTPIESKPR